MLPIQKLTLYKQGIGYFERQGQTEATYAPLTVPRDSLNDVLKSLTITVQGAGQLLGIDYETPDDNSNALADSAVKLADRSSLVDLLVSLRGRQVTLALPQQNPVTGRLLGVEASLDPQSQPAMVLLQLDNEIGRIQMYPLAELTGVSLHDEQARRDVNYFLDKQQTEQTRTTLTIQLSHAQQSLTVSYVAPSPTWRVGYRLVGLGNNQARLLSWGIFENSLDEDLEQVNLTLISGRPISFEYDLYTSQVPTRPQVSDHEKSFEQTSTNPLLAESMSNISHELRSPLNGILGYSMILLKDRALTQKQKEGVKIIQQSGQHMLELINNLLSLSKLRTDNNSLDDWQNIDEFMYRSGPLGDLKVSNAYFTPVIMGNAEPDYLTYSVETPVSVKRGQSVMVPIIDQTLDYVETCVYNGDKMPNHPLRVWQFQNNTGKALEQGPITLVNQGQYLGEGLMRFAGVADEIHVPYALEFGILVSRETEHGEETLLGLQFDKEDKQAIVERYQITDTIYTLTSHVQRDTTVYIERRDPSRGDYYDMPIPTLEVAGHTRWAVDVPANGTATFTIRLRDIKERREDINHWQISFINELQAADLLTATVSQQLEQLWTEKQTVNRIKTEVGALKKEYAQVVSRQEQLRKNLGILGTTDREGDIRNQILTDLETSENRRRELEQILVELQQQIEQHEQTQVEIIEAIYGEE